MFRSFRRFRYIKFRHKIFEKWLFQWFCDQRLLSFFSLVNLVVCVLKMSLLEQSRAISHVQGLNTGTTAQILSPHTLDTTSNVLMDSSAPNPDVLLALLTRNKALEGKTFYPYTSQTKIYDHSKLIQAQKTHIWYQFNTQ